MADNEDDKKVKDLIDAATRADLERWFSLPSFEQLADQGTKPAPPPEDPAFTAAEKRRAEAVAAIDPAFFEAYCRRIEPERDLIPTRPPIELRVDREISLLDQAMIARQSAIAEPREVQRPDQLEEDLRTSTPQALLRDLHRPTFSFDKVFEMIDPVSELRIDVAARVTEAMTSTHGLPPSATDFREARQLFVELREARRRPWTELIDQMPNRRVTE